MVERFVRDEEAVGSNPITPIDKGRLRRPLSIEQESSGAVEQ